MKEKEIWSAATLIGGGLDGLMILAALERIEEKLASVHEKIHSKRHKRSGTSGPCTSTAQGL